MATKGVVDMGVPMRTRPSTRLATKTMALVLSSVLMMALMPASALAAGTPVGQTFVADGVTYQVLTDATVQVGDGSSICVPRNTAGGLSIPATAESNGVTYDVVSIAPYAFYSLQGLTSIAIPDIGRIDRNQGLH